MTDTWTENPIARVDFLEAQVLADLASLTQDLGAVMQTCSRLLDLLKEDSKGHILIEALWSSALVRYARCFATGKRCFGLDESVFAGLNGYPIAAQRLYINLRNKHVAHSVNPFEQVQVGLVLAPTTAEKAVIGVSTLAMRHITADAEGVRQLGMLAKVVLGKVCELARNQEQKVLEIGQTRPIQDLYERARPRIYAPRPDAAGRPRE